jgi:citronellol/citronellal dehydrogenase
VRCDIRDEANVGDVVSRVLAEHGHIDALVNGQSGSTRPCRTPAGAIVNITADHSRGIPYMGHSSAARAGMANLTRTLAVEWASHGVRVNAVAPGYVASSGYDTYEGEPFHALLSALPSLTLARRHGTEAEVSAAIVFLLSPAATYITGQELLVAGGTDLVSGLWPVDDHDRLAPFDGFHRSQSPKAIQPD